MNKLLTIIYLREFKILVTGIFLLSLIILASCDKDKDIVPAKPPPTNKPAPCTDYIQDGYTDKFSYLPGEKAVVYLRATADISQCSCLFYDGKGAIAHEVTTGVKVQTMNANDPSANGFGYQETFSFTIPALPSGVYLIEKKVPLIIKSPSRVEALIIYPSNTDNAYNRSGGKSLYTSDKPSKVSFHRPTYLPNSCKSCLEWLPSLSPITMGYVADCDLDKIALEGAASLVIVIGHSEYWTRKARRNFDNFIDKGGNAIIMSGNTMWWQVRYSEDFKEMICYKDLNADPESNSLLKTVTWDQAILQYPILESIGVDFNRGGYGLKADNGWDGYKIMLPQSPLLENTSLAKGSVLRLPTLEYDGAPLSGFDSEGYPLLNKPSHFYKQEIIGFDKGHRGHAETIGTFTVLQKKSTSGIIINMASTDWCSPRGMGGEDSRLIKIISENAIRKLLNHQPVFVK